MRWYLRTMTFGQNRNSRRLGWCIACGLCLACSAARTPTPDVSSKTLPPQTTAEPMTSSANTSSTSTVLFGQVVEDPFIWLESPADEAVQRWVQEQDDRARASLAALPERETFAERLAELMYVSSYGLPRKRGARLFTSLRRPTDEKTIHYVQDGKGEPRVLLDPHQMSPDGSLRVSNVTPSRDGKWVAYLEQPNSADEATIKVLNVDTLEVSAVDTIANVRHTGIAWNASNTGFYYTWIPAPGVVPVEQRVAYAEPRFHRLGSSPQTDVKVFGRTGDASKFIGAYESYDGTATIVTIHSGWDKNQVFIHKNQPGVLPTQEHFVQLAPGKDAVMSVTVHRGEVYILTNSGAPRFRLFKTSLGALDEQAWREIVPEAEGVLEGFDILGGRLVLQYSHNAYSQLELRDLSGKYLSRVPLPTIGSVTGVSSLPDSDVGYFAFSSFTHPTEIYELDAKTGKVRRFAGDDAKIDVSQFRVEQRWYASKDGTRVSMFVVSKKGIPLDGKNPTLLTGYGGFNASMTPWYSPDLFAWLERGGVYALPNLRGGGEYGEAWHKAGMRENKQNVFDDFMAAARDLFAAGYTSPKHLGIRGGSNGGLLVGAAMVQQPDLFGAVVCNVPLLDMVRYHKFGLGRAWIPEYGDPDAEEEFKWLYAYSPYHHVRRDVTYPPLLMMSADTDDRVDPLHARKFIARLLQSPLVDPKNALLWVERQAGHSGADLRRAQVARRADEYAFLWHRLAPRPASDAPR